VAAQPCAYGETPDIAFASLIHRFHRFHHFHHLHLGRIGGIEFDLDLGFSPYDRNTRRSATGSTFDRG
jgi:hypothetical protein